MVNTSIARMGKSKNVTVSERQNLKRGHISQIDESRIGITLLRSTKKRTLMRTSIYEIIMTNHLVDELLEPRLNECVYVLLCHSSKGDRSRPVGHRDLIGFVLPGRGIVAV